MVNSTSSASVSEVIPALISSGFFDRTAAALKNSLAKKPHNAQAWERLVTACRANGDLAAAREACERRLDLGPEDRQTAYLFAILSGRKLPAGAQTDCLACPFVRIESFLTKAEHSGLIDLVSGQLRPAVPTRVGEGTYRPEIRLSRQAAKSETTEIKSWFMPRIRTLLPEICLRVLTQNIDIGKVELQMTMHNDGDFYAAHTDDGDTGMRTRRLSYAYYFHGQPKRFTGGDLLLYDSDVINGLCHTAFTRLEPFDNTLVFFPSAYFHQVTPIQCDTGDHRHGRFTVNGWIHAES